MDTIRIQVNFEEQTEKGSYKDTLYFTEEEYANISKDEIEKKKKERVDVWIQRLEMPLVEKDKTTLEQELAMIEEEQIRYDSMRQEVINAIALKTIPE